MRICQGCGGILGRDCYNEQDCISISNSQNQNYYDDANEINDLREQVSALIELLLINNIELPDICKPKIIENLNNIDDLPF